MRIQRTLTLLQSKMRTEIRDIESVWWLDGDFETYSKIKCVKDVKEIKLPFYINKNNERYAFGTKISLPTFDDVYDYYVELSTGREGNWDAVNPQMLAYINGDVVCGLDTNHRRIYLKNKYSNSEIDLAIHLYTGMAQGDIIIRAKLIKINKLIKAAYFDLKVLADSIIALQNAKLPYEKLQSKVLASIYDQTFGSDDIQFEAAAKALSDKLHESCYGYKGDLTLSQKTVHAVGHTHIDVAWLWDLRQTHEKVTRSYATALELQERFDNYRFMASQPILYEFLSKAHPELLEKIKLQTECEKWESEGAMYLEADCNLSSGESLIRQIEYGQKYFETTFGKKSHGLWLPDVFGYSAALPQILNLFELEWFVTSKISWNDTNKLPYDSFMWEGIDGSQIPTQFITTTSVETLNKGEFKSIYEGNMTPSEVLGSVLRQQQIDIMPHCIMPYGYGDGGGGATEEMLETLKRLQMGIEGMPDVESSSLKSFFSAFFSSPIEQLPIWKGELYLEYHRGTYTTNGKIKQLHRTLEDLLLNFEKLHAIDQLNVYLKRHEPMKRIDLDAEWRVVLLNEFHDILPGTSIEKVYEDAYIQLENAIEAIKIKTQRLMETQSKVVNSVLVIQSLNEKIMQGPFMSQLPSNIVLEAGRSIKLFDSLKTKEIIIQALDSGNCTYVIQAINTTQIEMISNDATLNDSVINDSIMSDFISHNLKPFECLLFDLPDAIHLNHISFSNEYRLIAPTINVGNYKIEFNQEGDIVSLYDLKMQREMLSKNSVLGLKLFEDHPLRWDAWDIDIDYRKFPLKWSKNPTIDICEGPVTTTVKVTKGYSKSQVSTTFVFYKSDISSFDILFNVDWQDHHVLLRLEGDFNLSPSEARYDIQFGEVKRPNDYDDTYHKAMFEVCAQHYGILQDNAYGVAFISNDKFGYNSYQNQLGISLLKSPTWPNPNSDQGKTSFKVSVKTGSANDFDYDSLMSIIKQPLMMQNEPKAVESQSKSGGEAANDYESSNFEDLSTLYVPLSSIERIGFSTLIEIPKQLSLESTRVISENAIEIRLCDRGGRHGSIEIESLDKNNIFASVEKVNLKGKTIDVCKTHINYKAFEIITLKLTVV